MRLKIIEPFKIILDEEVASLSIEGGEGSFTVRERHIDLISEIVPCIVKYSRGGNESYAAVNSGILLKEGENINISTKDCVLSDNLEELYDVVSDRYRASDEREKEIKTGLMKLEKRIMRGMLELEKEKF